MTARIIELYAAPGAPAIFFHSAGAIYRDAGEIAHELPEAVITNRLERFEALAKYAAAARDWGVFHAVKGAARQLRLARFQARAFRTARAKTVAPQCEQPGKMSANSY